MEEPNLIFIGIFAVVFIAALIIIPFSFFRMLTAKNKKTYWKSVAFFAVPIILVFVLAEIGGLLPITDQISNPPPESPQLVMPSAQWLHLIYFSWSLVLQFGLLAAMHC